MSYVSVSAFIMIVMAVFSGALLLSVRALFLGVEYIGLLDMASPRDVPGRMGRFLFRLTPLALLIAGVSVGFSAAHSFLWFLGQEGRLVDGEWETWRRSIASLLGGGGGAFFVYWMGGICKELTTLRHPEATILGLIDRFVARKTQK